VPSENQTNDTVNSDLPFPSGRLADERSGKADYREHGDEVGANTAEQDPDERLYRQCASRSALQREGITSNQILSQKRAGNVMEFSRGVKADLISAKGFGQADPVGSSNTPQGRAKNRRVELSVPASERSALRPMA
jgi:chemotaxis protein MotB